MSPAPSPGFLNRREFVRATAAAALTGVVESGSGAVHAAESIGKIGTRTSVDSVVPPTLLTPADLFRDVSRGDPKIFTLSGEALTKARLTPETWRLEIMPEPKPDGSISEVASISQPHTLAAGTALDLPMLMELGKKHEVRFLKAMQCLNIPSPLGQGLWDGIPLREVLRLCGSMKNVRRLYYWGYHNNDPKQLFQSSLSYTQAMETPPGELPAFLAYRLNGQPLSLLRGGPVRMVIPWAHGFKSIKWLQGIVLTNDYRANDTYAEANNDPESHLKTAAYIGDLPRKFSGGESVSVSGLAISGLSGLQRVEYNLTGGKELATTPDVWHECRLEQAPRDWTRILPSGVSSRSILGFDTKTGKPRSWPLPYTMISWSATLNGLPPGKYSVRARAVDLNGFAQPEPRPNQKTGMNALEIREFEVVNS